MYQMVHQAVPIGTVAIVPARDIRRELLDAAIEHVAAHGLTGLSLRELGTAIGTSHRMLSHHFGSKDELWVELIREVERRQRAVMAELVPVADAPLEDAMRDWWRHLSDPSLWPNERLFFEIYGQALQGRSPAVELLDGVVESWLVPATELVMARGVPAPIARAWARLGIAVTRGLLLDLLATGDRLAVDAAMERWIQAQRPFLEEHAGA